MNIAIILAGGQGTRTEQDIPKQFMNVNDKPLIIYTLENFEKHPEIDGILVVCLEGWHEILRAYARQYHIDKLKWIVSGGNNGQESTANGIHGLNGICSENDIVMVHDAIRPYVPKGVIQDAIAVCRKYGSGLSAVRCQETIVKTENGISGTEGISRQNIMRVQTPQAYEYKKAVWAYEEAERCNITDEVYINTLMLRLGEKVYFSFGTEKNIKITTIDDLEMFQALYHMERESWIKK